MAARGLDQKPLDQKPLDQKPKSRGAKTGSHETRHGKEKSVGNSSRFISFTLEVVAAALRGLPCPPLQPALPCDPHPAQPVSSPCEVHEQPVQLPWRPLALKAQGLQRLLPRPPHRPPERVAAAAALGQQPQPFWCWPLALVGHLHHRAANFVLFSHAQAFECRPGPARRLAGAPPTRCGSLGL